MPEPFETDAVREAAWHVRDRAADGAFYVAVRTTRIFCRPSCPARPKRENIRFLASREACLDAGFRACKRCKP
jgi:AraC family transcriptional regulator of adaptative response/methylated-DNA-[protein]-cysteine methyltransferase